MKNRNCSSGAQENGKRLIRISISLASHKFEEPFFVGLLSIKLIIIRKLLLIIKMVAVMYILTFISGYSDIQVLKIGNYCKSLDIP